jgi:hypothetical protein
VAPEKEPLESGFSDSERDALAEIARERSHRKWLGSLLYRWAKWLAAVTLGVKVGWDALSDMVKRLSE